jgi:YspA, cpYpsA-related SLOG family
MLFPGPKVAFTGGYECDDHAAVWAALDRVQAKRPGMHGGAPTLSIATCWAEARKIPQIAFRPDFTRHKNAAPFKRND